MTSTVWTPEKEKKFFSKLREMPNVSRACRLSGVSRSAAYQRRSNDEVFATAWDDAIEEGVEKLEEKAMQRAIKDSDTLLIFLLKAHRPEKYNQTNRVDVTSGGEKLTVTLKWPEEEQHD